MISNERKVKYIWNIGMCDYITPNSITTCRWLTVSLRFPLMSYRNTLWLSFFTKLNKYLLTNWRIISHWVQELCDKCGWKTWRVAPRALGRSLCPILCPSPAETSGKCLNKKIHFLQAKESVEFQYEAHENDYKKGKEHSTSSLNLQDTIIFTDENMWNISIWILDVNSITLTLAMK